MGWHRREATAASEIVETNLPKVQSFQHESRWESGFRGVT